MFNAQIFAKLLFELSHFWTKNIPAFRNNLGNSGIETVFDTRALRPKINELHVGSNKISTHQDVHESLRTYLCCSARSCHGLSNQSFANSVTPLDRLAGNKRYLA